MQGRLHLLDFDRLFIGNVTLRGRLTILFAVILATALTAVWLLNHEVGEAPSFSSVSEQTSATESGDLAGPSGPQPEEPANSDREALAAEAPDRAPVEVEDNTFTLFGEVLDGVSREPVTLFRMACVPLGKDVGRVAEHPAKLRTFANPIGTFTWRDLKPGSYSLLIRVEGYETLVVPAVTIPTREKKLSYLLSRGAYVDVAVNDFEGDGISDLEVRLNPIALDDPTKGGPRVRLRFTDNYGKAGFTNLPSGTYSVSLNSVGLTQFVSETFYLGPGSNYPVQFQVPMLNTVRVHAEDTEGHLLGAVQVRMWRQEGRGIFRTETNPDGKASIDHVPQGEYLVKLYKHGFQRKNQTLTVSTQSADVPLRIVMVEDAESLKRELNPTPEQLQRLKAGERPSDVFLGGGKQGGGN